MNFAQATFHAVAAVYDRRLGRKPGSHRPPPPLIALVALLTGIPAARAEIQIERTILPFKAAPSSFAIGLPEGVSFCFDPFRGGVSYAWTGGFVDLAPVRPGMGKKIAEVKLLGPVVYRESGAAPLRRGDPAHAPTVDFLGYTLRDDAVEFRYAIDGVPVREEISADAGAATLTRRFHIDGASDAKWWYVVDGKPPVELAHAGSDTFVLEIPLEKGTP